MGAPSHLIVEYLLTQAGTKATHIPLKSDAEVARELGAGTADFGLGVPVALGPFVLDSRIKGLAVTGPKRATLLPELPTMKELNITTGEESSWYAFMAPKGTPKAILEKVNRDLEKVLAMPDMKERETTLGYRFIGGSSDQLAAMLRHEITKWAEVAKSASLR